MTSRSRSRNSGPHPGADATERPFSFAACRGVATMGRCAMVGGTGKQTAEAVFFGT